MKFLIDNWYLVLTAVVSGGLLLWTSRGKGAGIGTAEAVRLINREKGVLIDIRESAEFAEGHAGGARNVPLSVLKELKNTAEPIKQLPTNKALPVVLMCKSGQRAGAAAGILKAQGYANAVVLAGGLNAWREANLPVEKSAA